MEQILEKKPVAQLEEADSSIKTYVQLLEKKLKSCLTMNNLNKDIERKLFVTMEELNALKMENTTNCQNHKETGEDVNKLKVENAQLDIENRTLKQHIILLQKEVEELKNVLISRTPAVVVDSMQHLPESRRNSIAADDPNSNSVLIKGFNEHQLNTILKINIIHLARLMRLKVADRDIVKVTKLERKYYERHNLKPQKIILIVQLLTPDIKIEFLKNKDKLKGIYRCQDIEISDYVSDEVYNLYQYAKILKDYGYAQIYWRNNCVYAKKTRSTYCDPVPIKTKADVDILKNSKE